MLKERDIEKGFATIEDYRKLWSAYTAYEVEQVINRVGRVTVCRWRPVAVGAVEIASFGGMEMDE